MLENLRHSSKAIGLKQSIRAIEAKKVKSVFLAKDADKNILNAVEAACRQRAIQIQYVESMKLLGKACGIEVGSAVACLLAD